MGGVYAQKCEMEAVLPNAKLMQSPRQLKNERETLKETLKYGSLSNNRPRG